MYRFLLAALLFLSSGAFAQGGSAPASPNDSTFRRARKLVAEGNGQAGRAIVDSVLKRYQEGSADYGDALFWRGALAETAAEAERDYRRVIVEYPLSVYVDDALLAIAELEQARGDRAAALQHLQRFVREHPVSSPSRGIAAFAAARLAFEQRDTKTACGLISDARASTPATNIELRNQIDYFATRCTAAELAPPAVASAPPVAAPAADTTTKRVASLPPRDTATKRAAPPSRDTTTRRVASPTRDTTTRIAPPVAVKTPPPKVSTPPAATPEPQSVTPRGIYTIQVAAYNTRAEAERLVKKLAEKNVKARVSGTSKPFRVRLDFFETRQAATNEVNALKARGIIGFVATEPQP